MAAPLATAVGNGAGAETTSRRADVTKIGPQHERPPTLDAPLGWLDLRYTKNDSEAFIPISPELRAALDAMPVQHLTYLHTQKGPMRSPKALGGDFRQRCGPAKALHDPRPAQEQPAPSRRGRRLDQGAASAQRSQIALGVTAPN